MYKERKYRQWVKSEGLVTFEVKELETDLLISAVRDLEGAAREAMLNYRQDIESYIKGHRDFFTSLEPVEVDKNASEIVKAMADAGSRAGVGPMAAVAGAVAEFVGRGLLQLSDEIIVENGGDIFIRSAFPRVIGVYAGERSPFTGKIAIEIPPAGQGVGVCTSSGTVSHSLSFGKADAVLIISDNTALADAAATAAGNAIKGPGSIEKGIDIARSIKGVDGVLILAGDKMGSWGKIKIV
ncbi:MAG: UPF0280 family protein [Candidatus Omnitrophota bacterium]|nr:UPF0280 family protein [Candidatus Omnitrophota bacterium]